MAVEGTHYDMLESVRFDWGEFFSSEATEFPMFARPVSKV